jgi:hypothetical protein
MDAHVREKLPCVILLAILISVAVCEISTEGFGLIFVCVLPM